MSICGEDVLAGREVEVEAILTSTADAHNISYGELIGTIRDKHIIAARRSAARAFRDAGFTTPQIARALRRGDHSTILNYFNAKGWVELTGRTMPVRYRRHSAVSRDQYELALEQGA